MGGFTFPSLPSGLLDNLLDTSPQVFYPAPKSHSRARSQSPQPQPPSLPLVDPSTFPRPHATHSHSHSFSYTQGTTTRTAPSSPRKPFPLPSSTSLGSLAFPGRADSPTPSLPPSISADDETGEWRPLNRRKSIGEIVPPRGSPSRPTRSSLATSPGRHRRSQSALPPIGGNVHLNGVRYASPPVNSGSNSIYPAPPTRRGSSSLATYTPLARLQEFSRNPLASTSAISLPTLAELGPDSEVAQFPPVFGDSGVIRSPTLSARALPPPSPIVRPRYLPRPSSRASVVSFATGTDPDPSSPLLDVESSPRLGSLPPPLSLDTSLVDRMAAASLSPSSDEPTSEPSSTKSSVGLSINTTTTSTTSASMQARSSRPPMSPRAHSQDVVSPRQAAFPNFQRRASVTASTSSVSDVSVLATWSFPASPESSLPRPAITDDPSSMGTRIGQPSNRLRDRLRTLSTIDTSPPPSLAPSLSTPSVTFQAPLVPRTMYTGPSNPFSPTLLPLPLATRPSRPGPPHMAHRHTLSTPNLLGSPTSSPSSFIPPTFSSSFASPVSNSALGVYNPDPNAGKYLSPSSYGSYQSLPPGPPGPRPKRPTTTRLRQPTQLSMPVALAPSPPGLSVNGGNLGNVGTLGSGLGSGLGRPASVISSSPGSMVSDASSICESVSDAVSLQRSNSSGSISDNDGAGARGSGGSERGGGGGGGGGRGLGSGKKDREAWWTPTWRKEGTSVKGYETRRGQGEGGVVCGRGGRGGEGVGGKGGLGGMGGVGEGDEHEDEDERDVRVVHGDERDEEERFIDFDDI